MKPVTEHHEQVLLIAWFKKLYPNVIIFAIPNGGKRNLVAAMKLKQEGVLSGVPDIFIPEFKIFIEMKKKDGGKLSQNQKDVIKELTRIGYICHVAHGAQMAMDFINKLPLHNNQNLCSRL
jgi:hypothetical protein